MTIRNHIKNAARGFRISDQPVVESNRSPEPSTAETPAGLGELPSSYGSDLLYAIARDPKSLFLYWDLDWANLFAKAGVSARQVYLRVFREDGNEEATTEIDPSAGHCYAAVSAAGTRYYCELGYFDDSEWKHLARSASTATPADEMSADFSAVFATLPIHLSFERLLESLQQNAADTVFAESDEGSWRKGFRTWQANRKVLLVGENWIESERRGASELALLAAMQNDATLTPEMLEKCKQLSERFGGSSWGGLSSGAFGQSSRA